MAPATFELQRYTFQFRALDVLRFDSCGPGNWLRGAFGSALRELACPPDCPGRAGLGRVHSPDCAYAQIFEPVSEHAPSGLADSPRPFVFRVSQLRDATLAPGAEFRVDVNVFHPRQRLDQFAAAFGRIAHADLVATSCAPVSISLAPGLDRVPRLRVEFLTPTELKTSQRGSPATFSTLFARARDRVSTLRSLYGAGPLEIDFRGMGERSRLIQMTRCEIQHVRALRRSSRTRQVHSIGGLIGLAEYEGALAEFLPILEAARWTGVGRHCVWGNGEILATPLESCGATLL